MARHGASDEAVAVPPNGIPPGCTAIEPAMLTWPSWTPRRSRASPPPCRAAPPTSPTSTRWRAAGRHALPPPAADPGDAYVTPLLLAFDGRERLEGFAACLNRVIARHDILRTAVLWEGLPEPMQVVLREAALALEWQPAAEAPRAPMWPGPVRAGRPGAFRIDVRQAPMLRALAAHDRAQGRWLLQLTSHHLVLDHTTLELLVERSR